MHWSVRARGFAAQYEIVTSAQGPNPDHERLLSSGEATRCIQEWLYDRPSVAKLQALSFERGGVLEAEFVEPLFATAQARG